MSIKIVFIGAGRMASAIVQGLLEKEHYTPEEIACTCGDDPTGPALAEATGIHYHPDITQAICEAEAVVLACKPQQFNAIDPQLADAAGGKLILSILAGTTLARLGEKFSKARNLVRTMPNTPGQIGAGVTAYSPLRELSEKDSSIVEKTLSSLGNFHEVEEEDIDAVTAVSGSGPAYVFEFAAALRDAGVNAGLPPELAESLSVDTLLGAAMLLAESEASAESLRDAVTSPGGTTAAALKVLEEADFRALINDAVAAAKARSIELAGE
ncbi:pyrroline-5-carboxylate reductase [Coraliomargarita sinensis]|uniref:Pyrroline-5-carboxylate reductase n=1 Tax=Coraliomargarita sinensis TaxID=2174842 RepID=A0A317ZM95_9BACT|nr:pyrroline-5-carboxylate reductase [Coraliomargarita sinensis]PXA04929.1 pyrroline-5-carboxylate reductase [Coraliomargarita sinensis]